MPDQDAAAEVAAAITEAMTGPSRPRAASPPPEVDPEAPHGRDDDGKPLAPFGWTSDGKRPKLTAGGRKSRDDRPRTTAPTAGAAMAGASAVPPPGPPESGPGLLPGLMEATEGIWLGGTIVADIGPRLPLIGKLVFSEKLLSPRKLSATMAAFDSQRPALAAALNEAAEHDARARRLAVKLASGDVSWVVTVMSLTMPFASALGAIWQGDKALAEQHLPSLDELAKRNESAMRAWLNRAAQAALLAQQAAQAMANGQRESNVVQAR